MDVKTTFLNENLEEEVYMTQPEEFISNEKTNQVCKLNRSIYGFIKNMDEACVYKKTSESAIVILVLYVDDILLIENDVPMLQLVKTWLSSKFFMKDLGEASYILGIKIYRDRSKRMLGLSQSRYIDLVLKRFSMDGSKRGYLPMSQGIHLSKRMSPKTSKEKNKMNSIPHASVVGSIMYAMLCTRSDVAYALGIISRFQADPDKDH